LKLARLTGMKPMDIAEAMVKNIAHVKDIEKVAVAHPGFINFTLSKNWLTQQV
jgi:arginyl-tRNA synthetase